MFRNVDNRDWPFAVIRWPQSDRDLVAFSNPPFSHHGGGFNEQFVELATLLRTDLENATGLLKDFQNLLTFANRQRQRLFAIDVFASQHRVDGKFGVPVINGTDHDRIDIFAIKNSAIIFVGLRIERKLGFAMSVDHNLQRTTDLSRIDICKCCTRSMLCLLYTSDAADE